MTASFPGSVKNFGANLINGDYTRAGHINDLRAEVVAIETALITDWVTANRTYYVSTTGSDSNDGLTSGRAFATIQKAIDTAASIDTGIYDVSINLLNGTYVESPTLKNILGSGKVTIKNNAEVMNNSIIDGQFSKATPGTTYVLSYLKFAKSSSTDSYAVTVSNGASVNIDNVNFGVQTTAHINATMNGSVSLTGNITISGSTSYHLLISRGCDVRYGNYTVTLSGTPNFSAAFVWVLTTGIFTSQNTIYSGSATGKRYNITLNGVINTYGAGTTYLPGDVAGTTATGGQYA